MNAREEHLTNRFASAVILLCLALIGTIFLDLTTGVFTPSNTHAALGIRRHLQLKPLAPPEPTNTQSINSNSHNRVYTFHYDPSYQDESKQHEESAQLLKLWEQTWQSYGWDTRILTVDDAKQHPDYQKFVVSLVEYDSQTKINTDANQRSYLKYLAMAIVAGNDGGLYSSVDVFPLTDAQNHPLPDDPDKFVIHNTKALPNLMYGTSAEWDRLAHTMLRDTLVHGGGHVVFGDGSTLPRLVEADNFAHTRRYRIVQDMTLVDLKSALKEDGDIDFLKNFGGISTFGIRGEVDCTEIRYKKKKKSGRLVPLTAVQLQMPHHDPSSEEEHQMDGISRVETMRKWLERYEQICGRGPSQSTAERLLVTAEDPTQRTETDEARNLRPSNEEGRRNRSLSLGTEVRTSNGGDDRQETTPSKIFSPAMMNYLAKTEQ